MLIELSDREMNVRRTEYYDRDGNRSAHDGVEFRRNWAIGQTFVYNYATIRVVDVRMEGDVQKVVIERVSEVKPC